MGTLYTATFSSSIGRLEVASTNRGLAYVSLPRASGRGLHGWRQRHFADYELTPGFDPNRLAITQLSEYLEGKREAFDLPLHVSGTAFQQRVYEAVGRIPYGEWCSYAEIARRIGSPSAVRAVGAANGANPLPLVIPCHRVLATSGQLQGYAGGLRLKQKLLAMEKAARPGQAQLALDLSGA